MHPAALVPFRGRALSAFEEVAVLFAPLH